MLQGTMESPNSNLESIFIISQYISHHYCLFIYVSIPQFYLNCKLCPKYGNTHSSIQTKTCATLDRKSVEY